MTRVCGHPAGYRGMLSNSGVEGVYLQSLSGAGMAPGDQGVWSSSRLMVRLGCQ